MSGPKTDLDTMTNLNTMADRSLPAGAKAALLCVAALAALQFGDGLWHAALAQNPFGGPRAAPEPQAGGVIGWLLAKQSEFYRALSSTIRAARHDGSAVWTLLGLSFAYGIFHAAGPGHGKAVISSYLVANEETARRGIVLSFASALVQALVAVLIVGIGAWLLNVTARTMCGTERIIEIASYGLIAAFGARLAWVKGRGFARALQAGRNQPAADLVPAMAVAASEPVAAHTHQHGHLHATTAHAGHAAHGHAHHRHDHGPHDHAHGHAHHPAHAHEHHHHHAHGDDCCAHGPDPQQLAGPGGWARGLGAVLTVGIRPCSGAILVLVFALAQGLFWAGVAATFVMGIGTAITVAAIAVLAVSAKGVARRLAGGRDGGGALALRGLEFAAAILVLVLGVGLLSGYVAAERVTCF